MPRLSLSLTLGWQFSPSAELKLPFAKPGLTRGASSDPRSRYESTPPSGRLVSDPPLLTGRNGLPLPLSRSCSLSLTNGRAQVKNYTFNSITSVQSLSYGLSDLRFSLVVEFWFVQVRILYYTPLYTECSCSQAAKLNICSPNSPACPDLKTTLFVATGHRHPYTTFKSSTDRPTTKSGFHSMLTAYYEGKSVARVLKTTCNHP